MSGVATLKLRGAKRHFDEMSVDLPISPQGCSPSRFHMLPPPLKRGRYTPSSFNLPARPLKPVTNILSPTPSQPLPSSSSPHPQSTQREKFSEEELAALVRHVPKRLKKVVEKLANGHIAISEKVFNVHDIRDICNSVVSEKEAKLSEEFAKILHERLAEQFRDFTKFNEDYVTRRLRGKDSPYLS